MPVVRFAVVALLLVVTACTQSSMESDREPVLRQVVAAADRVIASLPPLCTALRTEGYETRKRVVDDADATRMTLSQRHCSDDLQRLADAEAVEAAAAALTGEATTVTFTRCAGTRTGFVATISITNGEAVPVGVYAAVRATRGGAPAGLGAFTVVWQLAPGETLTRDVSGSEQGDSCAVDFNVFFADPAVTGDASVIAPPSPEQASDDHGVWFPALAAAEKAWSTPQTASVDGPATTEDLRSTSYTELVASAAEPAPAATPDGLCSVRPDADDPNRATVVATQGDSVVAGPVRRGADRAWRWLGTRLSLGAGGCP